MRWILVVEDEEDISEFLRFVLENADYRVSTAANLAEARAYLKDGLPAAVLLDRGLPDGDGLEICRELKGAGPQPSVLIMSALKDAAQVSEGLAAGADHYITKPFQFMDILARLPPSPAP
jgi:DNA-binding response OmpR family regulator